VSGPRRRQPARGGSRTPGPAACHLRAHRSAVTAAWLGHAEVNAGATRHCQTTLKHPVDRASHIAPTHLPTDAREMPHGPGCLAAPQSHKRSGPQKSTGGHFGVIVGHFRSKSRWRVRAAASRPRHRLDTRQSGCRRPHGIAHRAPRRSKARRSGRHRRPSEMVGFAHDGSRASMAISTHTARTPIRRPISRSIPGISGPRSSPAPAGSPFS